MAQKRSAQEAFGKPQGQLSAFAAAKLAKQSGTSAPVPSSEPELGAEPEDDSLATEGVEVSYDGRRSGASSPGKATIGNEIAATLRSKSIAPPLSTFKPTDENVLNDDETCLELALHAHETVTFIGEYDVEVMDDPSYVALAGAVIESKHGPQRVYAPSTHPLPQLRCLDYPSIVRVSSVTSTLQNLGNLSPLFRNIGAVNPPKGRSFALLTTPDDDPLRRSLNPVEIYKPMDQLLSKISSKFETVRARGRIVAIGAKSSGKSTFNRLLCNYLHTQTHLQKCLYLDLDPGQPEFTPPGQISLVEVSAPLLGPAYTHFASSLGGPFKLLRSHAIAASSFKDNPEHYKACVFDLLQHTGTEYPLVINTCGWTSGSGAAVLADLMAAFQPSDVVFFEPLDEGLRQAVYKETGTVQFHRLPRRAPRSSPRTSAELRAMATMSYFHHRFSNSVDAPAIRWSSKPISNLRPWLVTYTGPTPGIRAILSYNQASTPDFLAEVLAGSIVALVLLSQPPEKTFPLGANNAPSDTPLSDLITHTPKENLPFLPANAQGVHPVLDPRTSNCIGLALVRGIDAKTKTLQLLLPLSESEGAGLEGKDVVLVRGSFDPPSWAYLEDLYCEGEGAGARWGWEGEEKEGGRPWVSRQEMVGVEGAVWRLRHPPLSGSGGGR